MQQLESRKAARQRVGLIVFAGLAVLTVIEYGISVALAATIPPLAVIALVKAGLIVEYFMHLSHLGHEEEG